MERELKSELIKPDDTVNSEVNHNLKPPRPETTTHYWRMKEYKRRQTQNNIDIGDFI
jgi:hypothetical protein